MIWLRAITPLHTWHQKQMLRCLERGDRTFMRFMLKLFGLFFGGALLLIMLDLMLREVRLALSGVFLAFSILLLVSFFLLIGHWTSRFWDSFGDGLMGNVQRAEKLRELRKRFATERNE